jgi:hypothetical protein
MTGSPKDQPKTDAERVPEQGTGKLEADLDRIVEKERARQRRRPGSSGALPPSTTERAD